jgi:hypothetical protein
MGGRDIALRVDGITVERGRDGREGSYTSRARIGSAKYQLLLDSLATSDNTTWYSAATASPVPNAICAIAGKV